MNFIHFFSKLISIVFVFLIFFITLNLIRNYLGDLKGFLNNDISCKSVFLKVIKSPFRSLCEGKVIEIFNEIYVGNDKSNDICLKGGLNKSFKVAFYNNKQGVYIENFGNKEDVFVDNDNVLEKIKLNGNEIISINNISFKLIIK